MKISKFLPFVPFVLLFFLLAALVYVFFIFGQIPATVSPDSPAPSIERCVEGVVGPCKAGICNGSRTCIHNTWDECIVKKVCEPGKLYPCTPFGCSQGYRICNPCGDNFGPCIVENETSG